MAVFNLPELGENVEEGELVTLLVDVGDTVSEGQSIMELETGKATIEVPCELSGKVEEILVSEGDTIKVGQSVLKLSDEDEGESENTKTDQAKSTDEEEAESTEEVEGESEVTETDQAKSTDTDEEEAEEEQKPQPTGEPMEKEFRIPDLGENVEEGEVVTILVDEGDELKAEQAVLEVETGKATVEVPIDFAGTVLSILIAEGDKVKPNQAVLKMETSAEAIPAPKKKTPSAKAPKKEVTEQGYPQGQAPSQDDPTPAPAPMPVRKKGVPVRAAPSVRRFAREIGVDIHEVSPGTEGDRISIEDVKKHAKEQLKGMRSAGGVAAPPLPDFSQWGSVREEAMSTIRKITARHMAGAWSTIAHVTQHEKADITSLEEWRKTTSKTTGVKVTLTAVLLKQVASLLESFPKFNASIDPDQEKVIFKDYIHIGVAVDTPKGLLVPVIRDANQKSISELADELNEMASKSREGKISPSQLQGGTFTLTNLGGIGGGHFTPIVNHPEVAILGIGRGNIEPVFSNGAFAPRLMMPISLSYDHRLIDGADGARFVTALKTHLEYPLSL